MKKSLISMLLTACLVTTSLTTTTFASTVKNKTSKIKIENIKKRCSNITEKDVKKLFKKYNIKILSENEVKKLNLNKNNTPVLPSSISLHDLEKYIVKQQKQSNIVLENEVTIPINVNKTSNLSKLNLMTPLLYRSFVSAYSTNSTKTFSRTSTPLTDLTIKTSAAGSYKYDVIPLPGEPDQVKNLHFTSCDNGCVTELTKGGYNRLAKVNYSRCTINTSTQLKHKYSYVADMYTCIGIPHTPFSHYFKISSRTITGTTYYNLSI